MHRSLWLILAYQICILSGCVHKNINITSEPSGLTVSKGGATVGQTPLRLTVGAGDAFYCTPSYWSFTLEVGAPQKGQASQQRVINPCAFPDGANVFFDFTQGQTNVGVVSVETTVPVAIVKSDVDSLPSAFAKPRKDAFAIVIGVERYRQTLPKAEFATHDAQTVAEYLTKVLGYPEENVVTLLNDRASKSDFEKYFEKWLVNNVERDGSVFIFYSGHGAPNPKTGDAYLVPYDGDPAFIEETGYSLKRMYAALGKLPAKEVIVALDSCFSGAGGRSVIAKGSRPLVMNLQTGVALSNSMTVLSASAGDQTSSTYDEKRHGLFTYFMLKAIKDADVVRPDGSLQVKDIYNYMKPQVESVARKKYNNEQTPQLIEPKKN